MAYTSKAEYRRHQLDYYWLTMEAKALPLRKGTGAVCPPRALPRESRQRTATHCRPTESAELWSSRLPTLRGAGLEGLDASGQYGVGGARAKREGD